MTSIFDQAVADVLRHEGGLVDDPADPGGLTNFGFALRENPDLTADDIRNMTREQAIQRYYERRWTPYRWRDLPPLIACKVFDVGIDIGAKEAVICLQRACRALGRVVTEDGVLGTETLGAAGYVSTIALLAALKSELAAHYRLVAQRNPAEGAEDLHGWLNRAYE